MKETETLLMAVKHRISAFCLLVGVSIDKVDLI